MRWQQQKKNVINPGIFDVTCQCFLIWEKYFRKQCYVRRKVTALDLPNFVHHHFSVKYYALLAVHFEHFQGQESVDLLKHRW